MRDSVRVVLAEARAALEEMYGERLVRVILYGSQARGDARPDSDVDVLVVLRGEFDLYGEMKRLSRLKMQLFERFEEYIVFQPFSQDVYQDTGHPLMGNVHSEGIAV